MFVDLVEQGICIDCDNIHECIEFMCLNGGLIDPYAVIMQRKMKKEEDEYERRVGRYL